jgi:hypothetical protein
MLSTLMPVIGRPRRRRAKRTRSLVSVLALTMLAVAGHLLAPSPAAAQTASATPIVRGQWMVGNAAIGGSTLDLTPFCTIDDPDSCPMGPPAPPDPPPPDPTPTPPPPPPPPPAPPGDVVPECRSLKLSYQIFRDFPPGFADQVLVNWDFFFDWCYSNQFPVGSRITSYSTFTIRPFLSVSTARTVVFNAQPRITSNDAPFEFPFADTRRAVYGGTVFEVDGVTFMPTLNVVVASNGGTYIGDSIV